MSFDYAPPTYAVPASRHHAEQQTQQAAYSHPPPPNSYPPPRHCSYASAYGTQHDQHQMQQMVASSAATPLLDKPWTCGVCQVQSFQNRAEAEAQERRCRQIFEARKAEKEQRLQEEMAAVERAEAGPADLATASTKKSVVSKDPPARKSVVAKIQSSAKSPSRTFARAARKKTSMTPDKKVPMLTVASSSASHVPISLDLVPASDEKLSDYNNLIVRNVEFVYRQGGHNNQIGMRCIHCRDVADDSIANQSFFPGSVKSLASGLGSMGARHFGMGKCPGADSDLLLELAEAKKTHASQSKRRTGLGAYVAEFAEANGIVDEEGVVGIEWKESAAPTERVGGANRGSGVANVEGAVLVSRKVSTASSRSSFSSSSFRSNDDIGNTDIATDESTANVLASLKKAKIENLEDLEGAFVPSDTPYFWEVSWNAEICSVVDWLLHIICSLLSLVQWVQLPSVAVSCRWVRRLQCG